MDCRAPLLVLADAIMPPRCAFCGTRTLRDEGSVCSGCRDDLPWIRSAPAGATSPLECEIAPLAYAFPIDAAIKALKFRRRLFYGPALAQLLESACHELPAGIDAVQPVPLHWRRKWRRGFNQALEIARPVARHLGVPVIDHVVRRRATGPQSGLTASERARNLRGAFTVRGASSHEHVLLVDDVITTGTTMRQVARTVLRAGTAKVSGIAVARA
jgi:ComF family protein